MEETKTMTKEDEQRVALYRSGDFRLKYISLIQHLENESAEKADANPKEAIELLKDAIFMLKSYILKEPIFSMDELVTAICERPKDIDFETDKFTRKLIKQETGITILDGQDGKLALNFFTTQHDTEED